MSQTFGEPSAPKLNADANRKLMSGRPFVVAVTRIPAQEDFKQFQRLQ